jgi:hypothetical protein
MVMLYALKSHTEFVLFSSDTHTVFGASEVSMLMLGVRVTG